MVTDGLQEKIQRAHLIALKGVLLEGRCKNDTRLRRQHPGQLQSVQIRHLDIQKHNLGSLDTDFRKGQDGVIETAGQLQKRRTRNIPFQHFHSQRFVVHYYAAQFIHTLSVTSTE